MASSAAAHAAPSAAAAPSSAAAPRSSLCGYPSLLPGSLRVPPTDDPFWFDHADPTQLWAMHLASATHAREVQPMVLGDPSRPLPPKPAGHLRFVSVSDTHNYHDRLPLPPPASADIDVLLHGGDWSNVGEQEDVDAFTAWIRQMPIKYRVAIAGNHDVSFDEAKYSSHLKRRFRHTHTVDSKAAKAALVQGYKHAQATADNPFPDFDPNGGVAYLEDSGISIEGIRIWGSPWQPEFYQWAFNLPTGPPLREKWSLIPSDTQVLLTHGPPLGHGDLCLPGRNRAGCTDLLMQITTRIRPRYHVFGHIHEGYGQTSDGVTNFVNASNCNLQYDKNRLNLPIVFDVPLPGMAQQTGQEQQGDTSAQSGGAPAV